MDSTEKVTERVKQLEADLSQANALIALLRADLAKFSEGWDHFCEGCGAPIDYDEAVSTVADVNGCWGYVSDARNVPCYRYRTEEGAERSWPPCAALAGGNVTVTNKGE